MTMLGGLRIAAIGTLVALAACSALPGADEAIDTGIAEESPEQLTRIVQMAENGPKDPSFQNAFAPLSPYVSQEAAAAQSGGALTPVDNGAHELAAAYCTYCHSAQIITQQQLSREKWAALLVWMTNEQGMPELGEPEENQILDYLSANYGPVKAKAIE